MVHILVLWLGRVCNRIEKGTFTLNGKTYNVPINNGPNSLHGGIEGFSYKVFDYEFIEDGVKFHYVSKDGEEGYPGTLDFYAYYTIEGHHFICAMKQQVIRIQSSISQTIHIST